MLVGKAGPQPAAKDRALEMLLHPWGQLLLPSSSQRRQDGSQSHPGALCRMSLSQVLSYQQWGSTTGFLLEEKWPYKILLRVKGSAKLSVLVGADHQAGAHLHALGCSQPLLHACPENTGSK